MIIHWRPGGVKEKVWAGDKLLVAFKRTS